MAEIPIPIPKVRMRDLTIDIPDALVDWTRSERVRGAGDKTTSAVRDLSAKGMDTARTVAERAGNVHTQDLAAAATRARDSAAPVLKRGSEVAAQAVSTAKEQAGPALAGFGVTAATTAGKLAERSAELASGARERGAVVADRAREDWLPSARARLDEARPGIGDAFQTGAARASGVTGLVGATASSGAQAAAAGSARAARNALGATGSALMRVFRLCFWLGVVIWLLLRIFRPEARQREALYSRVRRLTGFESGF